MCTVRHRYSVARRIQCVHSQMKCSRRLPSSSSWCSGRLWKTEDHQRRHLTGGRRLQKQAVKGSNIVSAETQLEKDGQDVLNWSQPKGRMTKEDIIGTEIVLAMQAGPDWKSNQASKYGRVSGPVSALELGGMSILEKSKVGA